MYFVKTTATLEILKPTVSFVHVQTYGCSYVYHQEHVNDSIPDYNGQLYSDRIDTTF